jgi:hypothetical protein
MILNKHYFGITLIFFLIVLSVPIANAADLKVRVTDIYDQPIYPVLVRISPAGTTGTSKVNNPNGIVEFSNLQTIKYDIRCDFVNYFTYGTRVRASLLLNVLT